MAYLTPAQAKNLLAIGGLTGHYVHPDTQLFLESELTTDLALVDAMIAGGLESCGYGAATISPGSPAFLILADIASRLFRAFAYKRGNHAEIPLSVLDAERDCRKELTKLDKLPGIVQTPSRKGMSWGSDVAKFTAAKTRGY